MTQSQQLFESVLIMLVLILFSSFLVHIKILQKSNSLFTSKLVLKITLPALILISLASQKIDIDLLKTSGIIAFAEIACIIIAFSVARLFKFDKPTTGAIMLVSGFGMSTMLGYPIIRDVFPGNIAAMDDAVVTSEFGVGLLLFFLAPIISMYYGGSEISGQKIVSSIKQFLMSPIFISIILGITISFLPINHNSVIYNGIHLTLTHIGSANMFLVALTIGLLIKFDSQKGIILFVIIAVVIKLLLQPTITHYGTQIFNIDTLNSEIVLIESAMPSATVTAIFARQYNCKPELVSTTIFITLVLSLLSVSGMFAMFF